MLAIEFSFLQPHFFSTDIQDPARAEWPPHPDRVFAALVQAAYASEDPEEYRPVLQWVGRLAPPAIAAPEARSWNDCTQFVPCKLSGVPGAERYLKTAKRDHSVTLDGLNLAYCWADASPDDLQSKRLAELCERVGYLGSPRNMACARLLPEPPSATLEPSPDGCYSLRVPHPRRLEALENQHRIRIEEGRVTYVDPDVRWAEYRRVTPAAGGDHPTNRFRRLALFRLLDGPGLAVTRDLAQGLRDRLIACADRAYGQVPALLHGHAPGGGRYVPHVAFAPRASVNHPRADGRIHGIALLVPLLPPRSADQEFLVRLLRHPDLQEFRVGGSRAVLRRFDGGQPHTTREFAYQAPARIWTTVSPVMIDRFPSRRQPIEGILAGMLVREGLAMPGARVQHRTDAFIAGVPPVHDFHRHSAHHRRPSYHLRIEFPRPIEGPVTLGTTRYVGLGHFLGLEAVEYS